MKRLLVIVILLGCVSPVALAQRGQSIIAPNSTVNKPLVLYDDFNDRWIDPAKWMDWGDLQGILHAVIDLSPSYQGQGNNRRLRIFQRSNSMTLGDSDVRWGWLGLQIPTDPFSITEISFEILVNSAETTECPTNPNIGGGWAGFIGRFFNYSGQEDGDVSAGIELQRKGTDDRAPLEVWASYDSNAESQSQYLGYVRLGQTARLRVKWDQTNDRFVFQLNRDPAVVMTYTISDSDMPFIPIKAFWVVRGTPDCTTTPGAHTMMDVYFDNVYVSGQ